MHVGETSLEALRLQAQRDPKAAAGAAAREFEALFLQRLLQTMREASGGGPFDNEQTKLYLSMFDRHVAQSLAGRGLGLSEAIEQALKGPG